LDFLCFYVSWTHELSPGYYEHSPHNMQVSSMATSTPWSVKGSAANFSVK